MTIDPLKENIRLRGFLTLRSSLLLRRIHLTCNIQRTGGTTGQGEVVFAPADWDTLVDAGVPAPSEPDPLSLPTIDNLDLDLPSPLAPTTSPQPTPAGPTLTIDPSPAPASPVPAPGRTPSRTPLPDPVIPDLTLDSTPVVSPTPTATPPPTATPAPTPAPPTKLPLNPGVEKQVRRHSRRDVNLPGVFTEPAAEDTPATPEETAETSTETSDSTPLSPVTESSDSPAKKTSKRAKRGPISSLFLESEPPTESEDPPAQ